MPKIIDINKKRNEIAASATQLFLDKGYFKLTVSEVAKNAGISKGSIYHYFDSKEDIVFAIIELAQAQYDKEVLFNIENQELIENKILALFDLCIAMDELAIQRRKLYKEFIFICLESQNKKMIKFLYNMKLKYITWLKNIFSDAVRNNILKQESLSLVDGLFALGESILLFSSLENYNNNNLLEENINSILELIKIKKDK
jgi:AcrR family transcriptional regulator